MLLSKKYSPPRYITIICAIIVARARDYSLLAEHLEGRLVEGGADLAAKQRAVRPVKSNLPRITVWFAKHKADTPCRQAAREQ
eukprot:9497797-Pyramimonas_sp.AAC.2